LLHRLLRHVLPARIRRLRGAEMESTSLRLLDAAENEGGRGSALAAWRREARRPLRRRTRRRERTGCGPAEPWLLAAAVQRQRGGGRRDTLLEAYLFGVEARDPWAFAAATLALAAAALAAAWIPGRRAASVDPLVALRAE
jgi:hypothetical protein